MSQSTLIEDGQALLGPSSVILDTQVHFDSADSDNVLSFDSQSDSADDDVGNVRTHSDSSDDELEVVLAPVAQQVAVPAQQVAVPAQQVAVPAQTNVAGSLLGNPGVTVNVRYTQVPLTPMQVDFQSVHLGPWYTVVAGRFIGVFEDTGAADKATRKVSCSSHKAFTSQLAAVNAFNVAQAIGDLEVIN